MNQLSKKEQLKRHKLFATGLFVLMAVGFVATTYLGKSSSAHWIGYAKAFCEAAMVGALADWFAVTALFHYPLGLKIPHTNLIQSKKEQIGDNLGSFVVENFLSPETIRPYLLKLKASSYIGEFLKKPSNQEKILLTAADISKRLLNDIEDSQISEMISKELRKLSRELNPGKIIAGGIEYVKTRQLHAQIITTLSQELQKVTFEHKNEIRQKVREKSFSLVPSFVDNALADRIMEGIVSLLIEIERNPVHPFREKVEEKMSLLVTQLKEDNLWSEELQDAVSHYLNEKELSRLSVDIWQSVKNSIEKELLEENSPLKAYLQRSLQNFANQLESDAELRKKIDQWLRVNTYRYFLKNRHRASELISTTVGSWDGKELSQKLELEVGKDLQFIRVNGTLVGGIVGLLLYTISHFFI